MRNNIRCLIQDLFYSHLMSAQVMVLVYVISGNVAQLVSDKITPITSKKNNHMIRIKNM